MDSQRAGELLARERARIERQLADLAPHDSEAVTDPYEAADVGGDLFDEELGEGRSERLRDELDAIGRAAIVGAIIEFSPYPPEAFTVPTGILASTASISKPCSLSSIQSIYAVVGHPPASTNPA